MKKNEKQQEGSLNTARSYIKIAAGYASYKKSEGYEEDDYGFYDILNQDACLDICNPGPADYYFDKAYELLCSKLGEDHPETCKLVQTIISYHVDNAKRMMLERFFISAIFMMIPLILIIRETIGTSWQGSVALTICYALFILYWNLEVWLIARMVKQHYQKKYK